MKNIKINDRMNREEEKQLITDFVAALPSDSYLFAILEGIDDDCRTQISNDWAMNIIGNRNAAQAKEAKVESENQRRDEKEKAMQNRISDLEEIVKVLRVNVSAAEKVADDLSDKSEQLGKLIDDMNNDHKATIEARNTKIMELKAKLYDLTFEG